MNQNIAINVAFSSYINFTASFPPAQRMMALNSSNPLYLRYATLTQDSLQIVYYTASCTIPLDSIYQAAFVGLPVLTFPPAITTDVTPLTQSITAPASASYFIVASSEVTPSYQWYVQPSGSSVWFLPTASIGNYSFQGTSSNAFTASFPVNTLPSWSFECVVSNSVGATTSSVATLVIF